MVSLKITGTREGRLLLHALILTCLLFFFASAAAAADFTVKNTNDSGADSLREAITNANLTAAIDTIKFQIGAGQKTITLQTPLPTINNPVLINGSTQPGYAGIPLIEINANNTAGPGLYINASNCTIKGLIINRANGYGIYVNTSKSNTVIVNNYIGTNATGSSALPNTSGGIYLLSSNNKVGGQAAGLRNVISGNQGSGISIGDGKTGNVIEGNYIGTNAAGTAAVGNSSYGVRVFGDATTIGGTNAAARNVISGNYRGISLEGHLNLVQGNYIGTNFDGTAAIGNTEEGVGIFGSINQIGGVTVASRNLISGNGSSGVVISSGSSNSIMGNYIGTNAAGTAKLTNNSSGVRIFSNGNSVGSLTPGGGNLISGNVRGISIEGANANSNSVVANLIGTNAAGTAALSNTQGGMSISGSNNIIGGTTADARNVISGNAGGIFISGATAMGNQILGNYLGTNKNGDAALNGTSYAVRIIGSSNNTVGGTQAGARNVISGNERGISIDTGATGNTVQGNYIGLNAAGTAKIANTAGYGVDITGSTNNTVGGTTATARNVISGNQNGGVVISGSTASANKVQGNYIGTSFDGTVEIGSPGTGVRIIDAPGNLVGGTAVGARNLISGNFRGVTIEGPNATNNLVQGNWIGTDVTGNLDFGNKQEGVSVSGPGNIIGGNSVSARNVISGNDTHGVVLHGPDASFNVVQANWIGTKGNGSTGLGNSSVGIRIYGAFYNTIGGILPELSNTIVSNFYGIYVDTGTTNQFLGNSIFSNTSTGIDLADPFGITANDTGDPDFGPNMLQNYPLLSSVIHSGGNTTFEGTLNSNPNTSFRIEFFSNTACDPSGFGEGRTYLGFTDVATDASGNAQVNVTLPVTPVGNYVTATATSGANNTSEFSPCALVGGPNPGAFQFQFSQFVVNEQEGKATIMVTRSNGMTGAVSVNYATSNGSATEPADYTLTSGTLNFADGEVIKTFDVPVVNDGMNEGGQEILNLTLSNPTGGATLNAQSTAQLYLIDYDTNLPTTFFSEMSIVEGNNGTQNAVFNITVTPHTNTVTVGYKTQDGTAKAGLDYQSVTGMLTFTAGETSKNVMVPIIGDTLAEGDELFLLELTTLTNATVSDGHGEGLIIDDEAFGAISLSAATYNVNENDMTLDIIVQRAGGTTPMSVDYTTVDGTAVAVSDYSTKSGKLTFNGSETQKTVSIPITNDGQNEVDKTFKFKLSNPNNATLGSPDEAVITIKDDDAPLPVGSLEFSSPTYSVNEDGATVTITVKRTGGVAGAVSVTAATTIGSAEGTDYANVSNPLNWGDGDSSDQTFKVNIINDTLDEFDETFNVTLSNPTGGASIGNQASGVVTILDEDAPPTISISDVTVKETDNGPVPAFFEVTLSQASAKPVAVSYTNIAGGTATDDVDFQTSTNVLDFNPGETTKQLPINIIGDTTQEPDETFVIQLFGASNATIDKDQGLGTINNDDAAQMSTLELDQANYTVAEGADYVTINVTRTGDTSQAAKVFYTTSDTAGLTPCTVANGLASERCDYATSVGTLRWAANEGGTKSFSIPIIDDVHIEGNDTFNVTLSNATGANLGAQQAATVTITDNQNDVAGASNPIDTANFFIKLQYIDFLNRLPDQGGFANWSATLTPCPGGGYGTNNPTCDRIHVAKSFYQSEEFQGRGYWAYRFYQASLGHAPLYSEFIPDMARVGGPKNPQEEALSKQEFTDEWVLRPEFKQKYDAVPDAGYVDALLQTAGVQLANKAQLQAALLNQQKTRAEILREVVESKEVEDKFYVDGFVSMMYYGFLRRNPDGVGYSNYVLKLNQTGDPRQMVFDFIYSTEYRERFGPQ
jgi:hypothetical protein